MSLLPTPAAMDGAGAMTPEAASGQGYGPALRDIPHLLPTSPAAHGQIGGQYRDAMAEAMTRWGDFAAAIVRWEHTLGRPAPAPTMTSSKGNPQLSPAFTEWMMGLPAGWIIDVPGITRNEALKACGNGVVPQQAEAAIRFLLDVIACEAAA